MIASNDNFEQAPVNELFKDAIVDGLMTELKTKMAELAKMSSPEYVREKYGR